MSIGRFRSYLKNPFLGTHSARLTMETAKAVEVYVRKGPTNITKKSKSIFDIALAYPNLCVGKKFQKLSWKKRDTDPANPDHYWLVTRLVPKTRHPHRRDGKVWGVLVWKGQLWNNGEERPIWGASVKKWRLAGEKPKATTTRAPKFSIDELLPTPEAE
eukprot:TRINITY_DN1386_c0_g1_i1.p1 TRINITY_DN1386_c0_g1~~TRINITY_DN1386_c0_g1_i1.p1  ORF type:complete len:159 (-),score=39.63 TRINITY_DN1386_c0_g1_i1:29-505(-)